MEYDKLPRKTVFIYSIGSISSTLLAGIFLLMYVNFFWNYLGLNQTWFIIGQIIYATVNALNDPITGNISDHTDKEKWGSRRLIYIKWFGPLWAIFFFFMWFPWSYDNQIIIFLQFVISICVFDTFLSLIVGLYMSLMSEMTDSMEMRYKLSFYSGITTAVIAVPVIFAQSLFDISIQLFQIFNGVIAIISIILYIIVVKNLHERPELKLEHEYTLIEGMKDVLKSRSFLTRTFYNFCGNIASAMGLSFLFAYIIILGSGPFIPMIYLLITMPIGFFSQVLYMKLEPKWGMRKTILYLKSALIVSNLISFIIVLSTDLPIIVWICLAFSSLFGGFGVFNFALLTVAIDEDELLHGTRRESIFQGTSSLIFKPADSIGPIIATSILTFYGFATGSAIQSATAIIGIKLLLFVIPSILHAISLIFIYLFPYHGEKYEKLQSDLKGLHIKKKQEYELK